MNFFDYIKDYDNEVLDFLHQGKNIRVERIISCGQSSPEGFFYDQEEHEWVLLLQGSAKIGYDNGGEITLQKGDSLFIPAHVKHRVNYTSKDPCCIWLCVFYKD